MFSRLVNYFKLKENEVKRDVKYVVVEVEKPFQKIPPLTQDLKDSIHALSLTPAFQYILAKARLEKAFLQRQLQEIRHDEVNSVNFLQNGIYWAGWLERQLKLSAQTGKDEVISQYDLLTGQDDAAVREIENSITLVGRN